MRLNKLLLSLLLICLLYVSFASAALPADILAILERAYTFDDAVDFRIDNYDIFGDGRYDLVDHTGDPGNNTSCGVYGNCLWLDGNDDMDLEGTLPSENLSFSIWLRPVDASAAGYFLSSLTGDDKVYCHLSVASSENYSIRWGNDGTDRYVYSQEKAVSGEWMNLIFIGNASGTYLYVNGVLATEAAAAPLPMGYQDPIALGSHYPFANTPWNGEMDDFLIFNESLTQAQITILQTSFYSEVEDTTPPQNSTWNVTSDNVIGATDAWNTKATVTIDSDLLSLTVTTDEDANGSCVLDQDWNYTYAVEQNANYKFATTETTSHSYVVYDNITYGDHCLYCSFIDGSGNEYVNSSSGCLPISQSYTCVPPNNETWQVNMTQYCEVNATTDLTGYNITFFDSGNFTIEKTIYVDKILNLTSNMIIWIKNTGLMWMGAK